MASTRFPCRCTDMVRVWLLSQLSRCVWTLAGFGVVVAGQDPVHKILICQNTVQKGTPKEDSERSEIEKKKICVLMSKVNIQVRKQYSKSYTCRVHLIGVQSIRGSNLRAKVLSGFKQLADRLKQNRLKAYYRWNRLSREQTRIERSKIQSKISTGE